MSGANASTHSDTNSSTALTRTACDVGEYIDELSALFGPIARREAGTISVSDAAGRVLAADVIASVGVPVFTNSAMDGYAARGADLAVGARLQQVAVVPAGSALDPAIAAGECARIFTGAPLPTGADTVVPQELVSVDDDHVVLDAVPDQGSHVRHAGEALAAGSVVARASEVLTPELCQALVSVGVSQVSARKPVRCVIAGTGDELRPAGAELARGQIYESNSGYLRQRLTADGFDVTLAPGLPDDTAGFIDAMDDLTRTCDVVILTGGVSVGDFDVVRLALETVADCLDVVAVRKVAMQPGKPQVHARWGGAALVGLPGNPVSAAVSYRALVRPAMRRALGVPARADVLRGRAAVPWTPPAGRTQFIPVTIDYHADGITVSPRHRMGSASHATTALAGSDGLAVVPTECEQVRVGDELEVLLW